MLTGCKTANTFATIQFGHNDRESSDLSGSSSSYNVITEKVMTTAEFATNLENLTKTIKVRSYDRNRGYKLLTLVWVVRMPAAHPFWLLPWLGGSLRASTSHLTFLALTPTKPLPWPTNSDFRLAL